MLLNSIGKGQRLLEGRCWEKRRSSDSSLSRIYLAIDSFVVFGVLCHVISSPTTFAFWVSSSIWPSLVKRTIRVRVSIIKRFKEQPHEERSQLVEIEVL
jgi:hypothetical protein